MTGEKILNYKIQDLADENQIFRSFLAINTLFSKQVIVKTLKSSQNVDEKQELIAEIRRLAQVQHPHILTLYDYVETATEFYLVFEHLNGKNLASYIQEISGPIPEAKAKDWFLKILEAFALAHLKGIMNGNITASQIFINQTEEIKILDAALSRFYQKKILVLEDKETLSFASPEQIQGAYLDHRSDVYALGILLFQMLTGQNPYQNLSVSEIKQQICFEPLPPTAKFYPMVSEEIQKIIKKATAKNPADRFKDCLEFKEAILNISQSPKIENNPTKIAPIAELKKEPQNQSLKNYEIKFINAPAYVLIGLISLTALLLVWYNLPNQKPDSEVLFNLQDTQRIEKLQDSIARAQEKKNLEDSVKVVKNTNKKDTVMMYYHRVSRGENLEKIARLYYQPLDSLKKWNAMTGKEKLKIRDGIKVKVRAIYKIKRDENVYMIAQKFNISPLILNEVNRKILAPKPLQPGEPPMPLDLEGKDLVIPLLPTKK
jgi:serine/threonine protein kinase